MDNRRRRISDDDAVVIVVRAFLGESAIDLADEHNITQGYVSQLRHGVARPHVLKKALSYWHKYYDKPPPQYGLPGRRKQNLRRQKERT
jgi:hypothetical protein